MIKEKHTGIGFFEKYLTIWVLLCMAAGILLGRFLPGVPSFLGKFEYAHISLPDLPPVAIPVLTSLS